MRVDAKSIYRPVLEHITIPPAVALPNPIFTQAIVGGVGFVVEPVHEMAPHDMLFAVNVVYIQGQRWRGVPMYMRFKNQCLLHCKSVSLL